MFKKALVAALLLVICIAPAAQANGDIDWMQFAGSEITILMPEHPVLDGMRSVMDEFEAATGISVNVEALAENLYFDRMEVALRADEGVMDVYMVPMDSTAFTQWSNGLIHPLSPFINDDHMTSPPTTTSPISRPASPRPRNTRRAIWTRKITPFPFPLKPIPCSGTRTSSMSTSMARSPIPWAA